MANEGEATWTIETPSAESDWVATLLGFAAFALPYVVVILATIVRS